MTSASYFNGDLDLDIGSAGYLCEKEVRDLRTMACLHIDYLMCMPHAARLIDEEIAHRCSRIRRLTEPQADDLVRSQVRCAAMDEVLNTFDPAGRYSSPEGTELLDRILEGISGRMQVEFKAFTGTDDLTKRHEETDTTKEVADHILRLQDGQSYRFYFHGFECLAHRRGTHLDCVLAGVAFDPEDSEWSEDIAAAFTPHVDAKRFETALVNVLEARV